MWTALTSCSLYVPFLRSSAPSIVHQVSQEAEGPACSECCLVFTTGGSSTPHTGFTVWQSQCDITRLKAEISLLAVASSNMLTA